MVIKEKYSQEEWDLISSTPLLVGAGMSAAANSGIMGTMKEALANTQTMLGGGDEFADSQLVIAVAKKPESMADARQRAADQRAQLTEQMKARDISKPEEMLELVIDNCRKVSFLLNEKEDATEAQAYKSWLVSIADKVANSASEGGFLGFGGTKFSEEEKTFLDQIKVALGLDEAV